MTTQLHFLIRHNKMAFPQISSFASREEAEAAVPEGHETTVVSTPEELATLSAAWLAMVYNKVSEKPVRKFETHAVAVERTWKALNGATLLPVADEGLKQPAPPATTEEHDVAKVAKKEKTERAEKAPRGRKSSYAEDAKITILAEKNPKREGTNAHARFAMYRSGMLVKTFLEKGGTGADLAWDAKHGFIKVE